MTSDDKDNPAADQNDEELLASFRQNAHLSLQRLVATKAVITAEELAGMLENVSLLDIDKAVQAGRLFQLEVNGNPYYPAFYAAQDIDRTRLERVIKVLSWLGGWSQWQFFTTPKGSLGDLTPLQALQRKRMFAAVLRAASGFAER